MTARYMSALLCATLLLLAGPAFPAQDEEYKAYSKSSGRDEYFVIEFDDEIMRLVIPDGLESLQLEFELDGIDAGKRPIRLGSRVEISDSGVAVGNDLLPFDRITDIQINKKNRLTEITFFRRSGEGADPARVRRGNIIAPHDDVAIEEDAFVRGAIFSVTGNIEVFGEVNKDIVSLFGDIFIAESAAARGDIASIIGHVQIAKNASVYGEIFTGTRRHEGRSRRFYSKGRDVALEPKIDYNRVDGFMMAADLQFVDNDSIYPSVHGSFGYAFASKRTRFRFGLEQVLYRKLPIALGGEFYRELATEDDWIMGREENMFFTLLWTEDFRDYYETEGGRAYLRVRPMRYLETELGYRYDDTRWLKAHRNLWSLFGGDKLFPRNYYRVDEPIRTIGIAELDSTTNAFVTMRADYDTRDIENPFDFSAWAASGWLEWASPDFSSDYDYRRYRVSFRRYQLINRRTMLLARLIYGGSDGYLPMYKRFYLGGPGTARGYKNKEYIGTRYWLLNGEYRFRFPASDFAVSVLYDAGQISNEAKLNGNIEIKQSLGAALYVGDDFQLSLSKRLDGGDHASVQFYARLEHRF